MNMHSTRKRLGQRKTFAVSAQQASDETFVSIRKARVPSLRSLCSADCSKIVMHASEDIVVHPKFNCPAYARTSTIGNISQNAERSLHRANAANLQCTTIREMR